ncbi:MAG: hypothetical protein ABIV47_01450, partial [Roseiflexaceae bacterium]
AHFGQPFRFLNHVGYAFFSPAAFYEAGFCISCSFFVDSSQSLEHPYTHKEARNERTRFDITTSSMLETAISGISRLDELDR